MAGSDDQVPSRADLAIEVADLAQVAPPSILSVALLGVERSSLVEMREVLLSASRHNLSVDGPPGLRRSSTTASPGDVSGVRKEDR